MAAQSLTIGFDRAKPATGEFYLTDPALGLLDLTAPGFVVENFQIGSPAVRTVRRSRALNDGVVDRSKFIGGRVVTFVVTLNNRVATIQTLEDLLMPWLSPRYRPTLVWSHAGSPSELRALTVRGVGAPVPIGDPLYPRLAVSFESPESYKRGPSANSAIVVPGSLTEAGRAYDLTFDRTYPASLPFGGFEVVNAGTAPADWVATISVPSGTVVDPTVKVGDVAMTFDQNGGITLTAGQTLVIDTQARTVLLNADPDEPRYDRVNYLDWSWDDLRLAPGTNVMVYDPSGTSTDTSLSVSWFDQWL